MLIRVMDLFFKFTNEIAIVSSLTNPGLFKDKLLMYINVGEILILSKNLLSVLLFGCGYLVFLFMFGVNPSLECFLNKSKRSLK